MIVGEAQTSRQHTRRQEYGRGDAIKYPASTTTFFTKPRSPVKQCVRQNPFVIADRLTRSGPASHSSQTGKIGAAPSECVSHISDDEFQDAICDLSACRDAHSENQAYCQSVTDTGRQSSPSNAKTCSASDHPASSVREQQMTETHVQYHEYPVCEPSPPLGSHHHEHKKPSDCHYSASHGHHLGKEECKVRTQESRPCKQTLPTSPRHGQQAQFDNPPDRLCTIQTKSSPSLAQVWLSPEPAEDFRSVRSNLRQSGPPSKQGAGKKDQAGVHGGEERVRLSHYSPPPKARSTTKGPSEAEERLRKIRSEAQITSTQTTGHKEASKKPTEKDQVDFPAGPSSNCFENFLVKGATTEKTKRPAKDKCRGEKEGKKAVREVQSEPQPAAVSTQQTTLNPQCTGSQVHQCDWKEKYVCLKSEMEGAQRESDDIGLEGLTIVLHMKGKDDLVINTDLSNLDAK